MRLTLRALTIAAALLAAGATAETLDDDRAAFELRDDAMRQLGRNIYLRIGQVVQGRAPYGPDTVSAAEAANRLIDTLPTLFPPGSDVPPSRMRTELLAHERDRDQLIAAVQIAATGLVAAVKSGDKASMARAFTAINDACAACHTKYRNEN